MTNAVQLLVSSPSSSLSPFGPSTLAHLQAGPLSLLRSFIQTPATKLNLNKTLTTSPATMSDRDDSDAPEEFTAEEGLQLEQGIRKIQNENKERVKKEGKERRRKWSENKTPKPKSSLPAEVVIQEEQKEDSEEEPNFNNGMLPKNIIDQLAARERQTFSSDSEEEEEDSVEKKHKSKKKRANTNGPHAIILNNLPPPPCLQNSLDFLKKRKMQVPRSNAVLKNSSKALRMMHSSGLLN